MPIGQFWTHFQLGFKSASDWVSMGFKVLYIGTIVRCFNPNLGLYKGGMIYGFRYRVIVVRREIIFKVKRDYLKL